MKGQCGHVLGGLCLCKAGICRVGGGGGGWGGWSLGLEQATPLASKARRVTATPGIAMLAMADKHIQANSVGLQRVVRCCYEQNAQSQT